MAKFLASSTRWVPLAALLVLAPASVQPVRLSAQVAPGSDAPSAVLDSLLQAHSRPLRLVNGTLSGEGAIWLLERAAGAQFVGLGEEHNLRQPPELVAALFRDLQELHGFQYLAVEQDPAAMRRASEVPVRGNPDSIAALARRHPHAFSFISDQELEMLADVGRRSRAAERPLWGVDHAAGATHALDRLLTLPLPPEARMLARVLRDSAHSHEKVRDLAARGLYMGNPAQAPHRATTLRSLAAAARFAPGSEGEMLVRSMVIADSVFRLFHAGEYYENSRVREEFIRERFLDEYRHAATGGVLPRVLLKLGHWHLFRGLGPNHVPTLGNLVSELAAVNGKDALLVAVVGHPGEDTDGEGVDPVARAYRRLARTAPAEAWTVVDLRPLRPAFSTLVEAPNAEVGDALRRYIFGFDAIVVVGGAERATFVRTGVPF